MARAATLATVPVGAREQYVTRFNIRQRVEHVVLIVVFLVLAITGIIQKFYTAGVSQWLIMSLGGINETRLVHRIFAIIFTAGMFYHLAMALISLWVQKRKPAMMPTLRDFRGIWTELKHNYGVTKEIPHFGRFDHRQKFEYIGFMFGSLIIIVSGFVLMFPEVISRWLPGQVVAAALEFHGWEATLAVLTIVVWHIYDVVFRPGIFPADTTIFTGRISLKRMKEEHFLEYQEIMAQQGREREPEQAA